MDPHWHNEDPGLEIHQRLDIFERKEEVTWRDLSQSQIFQMISLKYHASNQLLKADPGSGA